MIGYVTVGTNDFSRAIPFFDALLGELDMRRLWQTDTMAAWGISRDLPSLCITKPFNGNGASVGNGVMVAFKVGTAAQVDAIYAKALALGGQDEGPAGPRGTNGFYSGYFRDLDGNKFNVYVPADSA